MNFLWFTWKDKKNPNAGGAETVNEELAKRLVKDGHQVILLTAGFEGGAKEEIINVSRPAGVSPQRTPANSGNVGVLNRETPTERKIVDGYKVIRLGNKWTVYWQAYKYYKKNLQSWADLVIDEVNTIPFFIKFYVKEKNIILCYQLCREIWFYQMFFPLSLIGFLVEPIYLWLLKDRYVLTESESTKKNLQKFGFKKDKISVFPIGLELNPISKEEFDLQKKEENPTILYLGAIRDMKRPDHVLKSFEILKEKTNNLKLFVVGSGDTKYAKNFFNKINNSKYKNDITYFGRVDNIKKLEIVKRSHLICVTSVKEGWGIIVTEANSQGTPAIVYDVDGLRDACKHAYTGIVCHKNPKNLAINIKNILNDKNLYEKYRLNAWSNSFNYNYDESYKIFMNYIKNIYKK